MYDSSTPLPFSEWSLITTTFACYDFYSHCTALTFVNEIIVFKSYLVVPLSEISPFKSSDMVVIGGPNGFKGKIVNFRIFNPGFQMTTNRKVLT